MLPLLMNMSVRCVRHYILSCMHWSTTLHPALQALEHCIEALHYILHYITSCLAGIGALHYHYILPCRHWSTALEHCIGALHYILHYITSCLAGIGALHYILPCRHWSTALSLHYHYILPCRHWSTALKHCITSCTTLHPVLQALELDLCLAC